MTILPRIEFDRHHCGRCGVEFGSIGFYVLHRCDPSGQSDPIPEGLYRVGWTEFGWVKALDDTPPFRWDEGSQRLLLMSPPVDDGDPDVIAVRRMLDEFGIGWSR